MSEVNNLRTYLRDVRRFPPLSSSEEVTLGEQMQPGQSLLQHLGEYGTLLFLSDQAEEAIHQYWDARTQITYSGLRFVVAQAKKRGGSMETLLDRIQDGNLALVEHVDTFDVERGTRFTTYAGRGIDQEIRHGASLRSFGRTARFRRTGVKQEAILRATRDRIQGPGNEKPHPELVAEHTGISPEQQRQIDYRTYLFAHRSLDDTVTSDVPSGTTHRDLMVDIAPGPEEVAERVALAEQIQASLSLLDKREQVIITARFGLGGNPKQSRDHIGAQMGRSREWVRQIELGTLERLRDTLDQDLLLT